MGRTETKPDKEEKENGNGNGDYKPANPGGKTVNIEDLKEMKMADLTKLAREMDVQGASSLKKQELIFKILQSHNQ